MKKHFAGLAFLVVIITAIIAGVIIFSQMGYGPNLISKIQDFIQGSTYQPSAEMAQIRSRLQLTERGEFLFNSARPELSEAEQFNARCREGESEIAVLGCYAAGNIYVYNITDERLNGIRELTSAHELLHVVWTRMSDEEKQTLSSVLNQVLEANQETLAGELDTYAPGEKQEELYVRTGTEIANLPSTLEQHYAQFFRDQDAIVAYYDAYISVFRLLSAEMEELKAEMERINTEISSKTSEYERRSEQLNADIISFNSCARVAGCFSTEEEFAVRRTSLVSEQESLERMYNEIGTLIDTYNAKVAIYNADVLESEKLNTIINSAAKPQEVK